MAQRDDTVKAGAVGLAALRRAAGYAVGRDLAGAMGIPASTYARYERDGERIPTRVAWALADRLGCSIDAVVGRRPADAGGRDLAAFRRSLSEGGRAMLDEYVDYLDFRERVLAAGGR